MIRVLVNLINGSQEDLDNFKELLGNDERFAGYEIVLTNKSFDVKMVDTETFDKIKLK